MKVFTEGWKSMMLKIMLFNVYAFGTTKSETKFSETFRFSKSVLFVMGKGFFFLLYFFEDSCDNMAIPSREERWLWHSEDSMEYLLM